ncbi:MAG: YdcF family protein [Deltaproteobacteria bacterium]|nr:YdcF family protein [Deltaproteobacteria bacterium]
MSWIPRKLLSAAFLIPLNILLIIGIGLLLLRRSPRIGKSLLVFGWGLLWILSTPTVSFLLQQPLQTIPALSLDHLPDDGQAIVVLGSGSYCRAPEYNDADSVTAGALERLRYAARLHRKTGKPILVTGGRLSNSTPEATFMKETLEQDFQVPVRWTEEESRNTMENARLSYALLQPQGVTHIYLVTNASHMSRSQMAFERAGFQVIAAPISFATRCQWTPLELIPNSSALETSADALYEAIGWAWYWLRTG